MTALQGERLLRIPAEPEMLELLIELSWDGSACSDRRRHGRVRLASGREGLSIEASLPHQRAPRIPPAPPGVRIANLWEYDVVECFLAGEDGRYLEVELGAGGHFLLLSFDAPRRLRDAHEGARPSVAFERTSRGWTSRLRVDWSLVPPRLCALDAFVIAAGAHLAYHPLPGDVPDFHQPDAYPRAAFVDPRR